MQKYSQQRSYTTWMGQCVGEKRDIYSIGFHVKLTLLIFGVVSHFFLHQK